MERKQRLAVLGSTGSIGTQTLDIVRNYPERFEITALTAHSNWEALAAQAVEFAPDNVVIANERFYTPLREALSAFVDSTQETVTGDVKLKLYKGNIIPASVTSPYSLYMEDIATFGDSGEMYSHKDAAGFINLYGLPLKVQAMMKEKAGLEK